MTPDNLLPSDGRDEGQLTGPARTRAYPFIGALYFLTNFASPSLGLVDIPVSFFLKNRMHLDAHSTSVFRLGWAVMF